MLEIIQGDALQLLRTFGAGMFDAVITDPPYSSGGMTISEKQRPTSEKYTNTKGRCPFPDFEGDCKDQRSWTSWMAEWMTLARQCSKPGAPICVFSDWRQVGSLMDAIQWAGWQLRGLLSWDKTTARPQRGRFRPQCEFIAWGSNGHMPLDRNVSVLPGAFRVPAPSPSKRIHQTEKPVALLRELVRICEPGGAILDPFAGSGSTLEAAYLEGYSAIGIEMVESIAMMAQKRVKQMLLHNS